MSTAEQNNDLDYDDELEYKAAGDAIRQGRKAVRQTSHYWRQTAQTLTEMRQRSTRLPATPSSLDDWYTSRPASVPFELEELEQELQRLDRIITKAWTLVAVCDQEAQRMDGMLKELAEQQAEFVAEVDER